MPDEKTAYERLVDTLNHHSILYYTMTAIWPH